MLIIFSLIFSIVIIIINAKLFNNVSNNYSITGFAESIFLYLICVAMFLSGKIYAKEWGGINNKSLIKSMFENVWLPILVVYILSESIYFFTGSIFENVIKVCLIVSLSDIDGSISRNIPKKLFIVNDVNKKFCYLHYPPKDRVDILPMDLTFHLVSLFILIKKLT